MSRSDSDRYEYRGSALSPVIRRKIRLSHGFLGIPIDIRDNRPVEAAKIIEYVKLHPALVTAPLIAVGVVGFCLCAYVIALHHDAVLYARTVNGIRAYFVARATDEEKKSIVRVLPTDPNYPKFGGGTFGYVVMTFATVNTGYIFAAVWAYFELRGWPSTCAAVITLVLVLGAHLVLYDRLTRRQVSKWNLSGSTRSIP